MVKHQRYLSAQHYGMSQGFKILKLFFRLQVGLIRYSFKIKILCSLIAIIIRSNDSNLTIGFEFIQGIRGDADSLYIIR